MKKKNKTGHFFFFYDFHGIMIVSKTVTYKLFQLKVSNVMFLLNSIENKALKSICVFHIFTLLLRIIAEATS